MTAEVPVYVINLDRVPERMAEMRAQFSAAGLADRVVRFPAVDGQSEGFRAPGYAPASWLDRWSLKTSEQAIFESHRAVWQRIVDRKLPGAIICEDDILVSAGFAKAMKALDLERSGIVKLDGFFAARRYGPARDMAGITVRAIREPVPSAACYAVSGAAARILLDGSARYCMTLDDYVFQPRPGLDPVQLFPAVAVQGMCVVQAGVSEAIAKSERDTGAARNGGRASKGPLAFRLRKELIRLRTRLGRRFGGDRALLASGGVIAMPELAPDLPAYRA